MNKKDWNDYKWMIMKNPKNTRVWISHGYVTLEIYEPKKFDEKIEVAESLVEYLNDR